MHRAVLQLLEPETFPAFLASLATTVATTLRVESLALVLESPEGHAAPPLAAPVRVAPPGFVDAYLTASRGGPVRPVVLRQTVADTALVHGDMAPDIRSEAAMRLDLGPRRLPGMLVLGSEDPHQFRPAQGTDLLAFLAASFERVMRRWLS